MTKYYDKYYYMDDTVNYSYTQIRQHSTGWSPDYGYKYRLDTATGCLHSMHISMWEQKVAPPTY